jgi:hypothetical protein
MGALRAGLPDGLDGRRLGCGEELVHDFGAGGDDGSQFAAVDDLGGVPLEY